MVETEDSDAELTALPQDSDEEAVPPWAEEDPADDFYETGGPQIVSAGLLFMLVACVAFLPLIYSTVVWYIFIYKIWDALRVANPRTTPGKAVGFLFIPFYNLYWIFQAFWGWAKDFNAYASRCGIPKVSEGISLAFCILWLVCAVPYLGLLAAIPALVLQAVFISKACDGVNALARAFSATNTAS